MSGKFGDILVLASLIGLWLFLQAIDIMVMIGFLPVHSRWMPLGTCVTIFIGAYWLHRGIKSAIVQITLCHIKLHDWVYYNRDKRRWRYCKRCTLKECLKEMK